MRSRSSSLRHAARAASISVPRASSVAFMRERRRLRRTSERSLAEERGHRRPGRGPSGDGEASQVAEGRGSSNGKVGEYLPIEIDARLLQTCHQPAVRHAVLSGRRIDADDPQSAKITLPNLAIAIRVRQALLDCRARLPVASCAGRRRCPWRASAASCGAAVPSVPRFTRGMTVIPSPALQIRDQLPNVLWSTVAISAGVRN